MLPQINEVTGLSEAQRWVTGKHNARLVEVFVELGVDAWINFNSIGQVE